MEKKKLVFGPFKAGIHRQGESQRGVFFPKAIHDDPDFVEAMNTHKWAVTVTLEPVSTLD